MLHVHDNWNLVYNSDPKMGMWTWFYHVNQCVIGKENYFWLWMMEEIIWNCWFDGFLFYKHIVIGF